MLEPSERIYWNNILERQYWNWFRGRGGGTNDCAWHFGVMDISLFCCHGWKIKQNKTKQGLPKNRPIFFLQKESDQMQRLKRTYSIMSLRDLMLMFSRTLRFIFSISPSIWLYHEWYYSMPGFYQIPITHFPYNMTPTVVFSFWSSSYRPYSPPRTTLLLCGPDMKSHSKFSSL